MTIWGNTEAALLRATQEAFMPDSCQVGTITTTQDAIGDLVPGAPSYAAEIACGLDMKPGAETRNGELTVTNVDAVLRLPHVTAVSLGNVVKITKRNGVAITPTVYEVQAEPRVGVTAVVCQLRKVTT